MIIPVNVDAMQLISIRATVVKRGEIPVVVNVDVDELVVASAQADTHEEGVFDLDILQPNVMGTIDEARPEAHELGPIKNQAVNLNVLSSNKVEEYLLWSRHRLQRHGLTRIRHHAHPRGRRR